MAQNSPPSSTAKPAVTTETFQKHYGRGPGYLDENSHHHGHPPPQQSYPPTHYSASGQHQHPPPPPLPPPPPPEPHGGPPFPPPNHGHHHHPSWYYPPHAAAASASAAPSEMSASPSSRRSSSRASKKSNSMPIPLVTPKSHDSDALPSVADDVRSSSNKKPAAKLSNKKAPKKKESSTKVPPANDKEPEMEEEPQVDPMKQDFHYYAADHYEEVKEQCQKQLDTSLADGSISEKNKQNQLYLLTTLLNNRLIKNWEEAPASTRAEYLKKEEADRKRFMSEEEVASRHCATLTARRRSPKQSGALGRAGSFGLATTLEMHSLSANLGGGSTKRPNSAVSDADVLESAVKRVKAG